MKQTFLTAFILLACFVLTQSVFAQIPTAVMVRIVRAEDERRYDATLENLMKDANPKIRVRAALAAGRIGDERAIPALINFLKDDSVEVQTMAMFALGETESAQASAAILEFLKNATNNAPRARAVEAAGKIALANPKDANTPKLGEAIVSTLKSELGKNSPPNYEVILLGETAVLRARPAGGEELMIRLLSQPNARLRADALNTLARLRSKKANSESREFLQKDSDPVVRANAARMLGVGEDKSAIDLLLKTALSDSDSRVRVAAIRSLGSLKDASVAGVLIERGEFLLDGFEKSKNSVGKEKSELLEIVTALGNILRDSHLEKAWVFIDDFRKADGDVSSESMIALARIAPEIFVDSFVTKYDRIFDIDWRIAAATFQGAAEIPNIKSGGRNDKEKSAALRLVTDILDDWIELPAAKKSASQSKMAIPYLLSAVAAFKIPNSSEALIPMLREEQDVQIRAAIVGILADQPMTKENVEALKTAFTKSLLTDESENDAQLAILDALYKLDKKASVGIFLTALNAPDYLVRKKAFEILADAELQKDFPGIKSSLENARAQKKNQVLPFAAYTGTKLGQILNSQADYTRAVSRKNGTVKAVLTTTKGNFTIDFYPEEAPLTVDNFIRLARANYFNGVFVHRVVPNFVMQDGDPRGDGNGGPGWQIRCEINMLPFERGWVGMALSGKDTGGSQWFATHSPQPHLDGGYTVFGRVNETDMKVVDSIVRGDKILSVRIVENGSPRNSRKNK